MKNNSKEINPIISTSQIGCQNKLLDDDTESDIGSPAPEIRECAVSAPQHGERLDRVLVEVAPEFSRSYLQKLMADGAVKLNGACIKKPSTRVQVGARVSIELRPTPDTLAFRPQDMALDIVYEDSDLLVINKPAGLVVHPAAGNWSGTLLNGLLAYDARAAQLPRAGIVHRLDKDTSGLMLVGRTIQACTALVRMIAQRSVRREYIALAHGRWLEDDKTRIHEIDAPIGRDPKSRIKMGILPQGKAARTDVMFLDGNADYTLVQCKLHTGRTHQIRVHMASIGHPLVGDTVYGGRVLGDLHRQALHAYRLALQHPISCENLCFEQQTPSDLRLAVKIAGLGYNL